MKWGVCLLIVTAVLAAPAAASAPTLQGLQRQLGAVQKQLVQMRANQTAQARLLAAMSHAETVQQDQIVCGHAVESDDVNSVWHTLGLLAQYDGFPAQPDFPRFDDQGACARLGITRIR